MSSEHNLLGDNITLKDQNGKSFRAGDKPFELPNKSKLTYGQVSLLAGDYFGTNTPISDGKHAEERADRFEAAWISLAGDEAAFDMAKQILVLVQPEIDATTKAYSEGRDPSKEVFASKSEREAVLLELRLEAASERGHNRPYPSYLRLALDDLITLGKMRV